MEIENRIDISRIVGRIAVVLMKPYTDFMRRLQAEGRVTDAEIEALRREFFEASEHLGEPVQELMKEDSSDPSTR